MKKYDTIIHNGKNYTVSIELDDIILWNYHGNLVIIGGKEKLRDEIKDSCIFGVYRESNEDKSFEYDEDAIAETMNQTLVEFAERNISEAVMEETTY